MVTWLKLISKSISLSWFLLLCIWKIWMKISEISISWLLSASFSFSWTPRDLAEFISKTCLLRLSWLNFTNWGRSVIQSRILVKTGFPFNTLKVFIRDSANSTQRNVGCWKNRISPSTQKDYQILSLTVFLNSILRRVERWTIKVSLSSCWPWKTKNHPKQSNISGEC